MLIESFKTYTVSDKDSSSSSLVIQFNMRVKMFALLLSNFVFFFLIYIAKFRVLIYSASVVRLQNVQSQHYVAISCKTGDVYLTVWT